MKSKCRRELFIFFLSGLQGDNDAEWEYRSLEGGDLLICAAPAFEDRENLTLYEVEIDKNHKWRDKPVNELEMRSRGMFLSWSKREERKHSHSQWKYDYPTG